MKRLLSLTTMLFMAIASFAHDFEVGGIYYEITSSTSTPPTVSVSYEGTFSYSYNNEYSGNVTIPESVTYSGKTYSVTSIGNGAFYGCEGLTSVTIPSNVTSIGGSAFSNCSSLTSITIPSSVTSIGSSAFSGCSGLTSVTIPSSVTAIGSWTFNGCTGLTSITIPSSVTSISQDAFWSCSGLSSINVDKGNAVYDSRDNCNAIIETSTNTLIRGCKTTTIPSSVTSIGIFAFDGCSGLTSITIPSSVTKIGSSAFSGCSGLTSVTIPSSVTTIGDAAFYNTAWYNNQPDGLVYAGKVAYEYKGTMPSNTSIVLEEGTLGIADRAFLRCSGLTSMTIPSSVTTIGGLAFYECSGLTSLIIPSSVTSIGSGAFDGCSGLTGITIPDGVTQIDVSTFYGCSSLTSITIPSSITSIGEGAFSGCSALSDVTLNSDAIASKTYTSSSSIKDIFGAQVKTYTLGGDITSIGSYAFYGCSAMETLKLSNNLKRIEPYAFYGCSGLGRIDIPSGVTSIDDYAFYNCTGLTSVTIPSSVTSIGSDAFRYCNGLTSINIPSSVTSIGSDAFYYCTDTKFYVDKNTIALFVLWRQILDKPKTGYPKYASENVYDINTGEKIEFFKTTASSVRVVSPEPKNYTITSQSLTIDGKSVESPYYAGGLSPNTNSNVSLTIKYKDAEGSENTFYTTQTVKTQELTLTTEQPKVVSMGNVIVSATTNVDEEEKNVGFEWRRRDWTSDFASNSGNAVIYDNTMEGYIRNLYTDKLWNYRAYYLSDSGTYYYGDWVGIDPTNTSYFEPTVHTYADISTSGKVALIRGYVLNGTDKITVQGFKYWKTANKSNSLDIAIESKPQAAVVYVPADAITETVAIVGAGQQLMNATLENLDYGSTYQCVAFATTSENETFYGEVQSFTTEAGPTGIEGVKEDARSSKPVTVVACYDINGKQLSAPQKGLNILKMSDGTTRKIVR